MTETQVITQARPFSRKAPRQPVQRSARRALRRPPI